jgi:hypothetical protein
VGGVRPVVPVVLLVPLGPEPAADMDHHQQRLDPGDRPHQGRAAAEVGSHHRERRADHRDHAPELQVLSILHGHRRLSPS